MSDYQLIARKARQIARTLGYRAAAGYCRNKGLCFYTAHAVLIGHIPRKL